MRTHDLDFVIFGSGITGLWLLNRLHAAGFHCILLESDALGGTQTLQANGIIHGGMKFGLSGLLSPSEDEHDMVGTWRACLEGRGEIDLSGVRVLSQAQYLWSEPGMMADAFNFLSSKLHSGEVSEVGGDERPLPLQHESFAGSVWRLRDFVVDVPSLIDVLAAPHRERIYRVDYRHAQLEVDDLHQTRSITITGTNHEPFRLRPQRVIFAAGAGNAELLEDIGVSRPGQQARPLHPVVVKAPGLPPLYAHCAGNDQRPRLTVTTHVSQDGSLAWYLGGELAEDGVTRDERLQVEAARHELEALLPWLDWRHARFRSFRIDRILPEHEGLLPRRNDRASVTRVGNHHVIWPGKLTLAPQAAQQVIDALANERVAPLYAAPPALPLAHPVMASPAWETLFSQGEARHG